MKRASALLIAALAPWLLEAQSLKEDLASAGSLADSLKAIYAHIEYPSGAFHDLKETWIITDPLLTRDIVNRLIAGGGLLRGGAPLSGTETQALLEELYNGRTSILVRRRAFDDELESIALFGSSVATDPVTDWVYLSDLLAEPTDIYREIKAKGYAYTEVTKPEAGRARFQGCDLQLSASRAEVLLWSTHPGGSETRDEYRLSLVGLMGNGDLNLPFWFKSSVVAGVKVGYQDDLRITDREYEKFTLVAGPEIPINFSIPLSNPTASNPFVKPRILQSSGTGIFLRGAWIPRYGWPEEGECLQIGLETSLALSEKAGYAGDIPQTFPSIRNSVSASAFWKHLGGFADLGVGASWHDLVYRNQGHPPGEAEMRESHTLPFLQAGISRDGPLVQYAFSMRLDMDLTDRFSFIVVKSQVTLGSTFGVDIQYFKAVNPEMLPAWHYGSYPLISPVIRINY